MDKVQFYDECYTRLKETKLRHNKEKIECYGYQNQDDYHTMVMPEGFDWEPVSRSEDGGFHSFKEWGENFRNLMETQPPYVDPYSPIAGGMYFFMSAYSNGWNEKDYPYDHLKPYQELYDITHGIGAYNHMCGDVKILFKLGWGGLLEKVRHYRAAYGDEFTAFYEAEENVIIGIQGWIANMVKDIEQQLLFEKDEFKIANLIRMKEINSYLIEGVPRTFHEACQLYAHYNIAGRSYARDGAGGQIDEILRPYYEKDIKAGIIDDDDVRYILAGLLLSDTKYYQLSGPDETGQDMTSRMSYLVLEAADRLNITANITVRVHDGLDNDFYLKAVSYLFKHKNGWPRFSGDNSLVKGFMKLGYSAKDARNRIAVGCNWMALPAKEYCMNDCVKNNVAKIFDVAFQEAAESEYVSVEKIWDAFKKHLSRSVQITVAGLHHHLDHQWDSAPELFLNLFMEGPIEQGHDITDGSAEMYNIGIDGVGIAVVADSLAALEQYIEVEKKITWEQIINAINTNFEGMEGERIRLLMKNCDNYGKGMSIGDKWGKKISELFTETVVNNSNSRFKLVPGWFSWSKTIEYGKTVGATPNGRRAGEPINHNANPFPGFREDAAATALSSTVAIAQCGYGNTTPMQIELDPHITSLEGGVEDIAALMKTHFELGGTLININIVDANTIRRAHKNPEAFPDLVVRVTGFTAYFSALSPEFRQLVVDRILD